MYLFANIDELPIKSHASDAQHFQIETIELRHTCQFLMPDSQSESVNNIH